MTGPNDALPPPPGSCPEDAYTPTTLRLACISNWRRISYLRNCETYGTWLRPELRVHLADMTSDRIAGKQGHAPQVLRSVAGVVLAIAGLPLLYVVGAAYWHSPTFRDLLSGLGAPLPASTALFLASFRWWALLLLLFGAFAIDILRRPSVSLAYLLFVAIGTIVTAILLHAWMYEALLQPLTQILEAVE